MIREKLPRLAHAFDWQVYLAAFLLSVLGGPYQTAKQSLVSFIVLLWVPLHADKIRVFAMAQSFGNAILGRAL
jgi:hypothetical protein